MSSRRLLPFAGLAFLIVATGVEKTPSRRAASPGHVTVVTTAPNARAPNADDFPAGVQPWLWSDAERAARRLTRQEGGSARHGTTLSMALQIDGHIHPELFFPSELMRSLLNEVQLTRGDEVRRRHVAALYAPWFERLGWDSESFWRDVANVGEPYFALNTNEPASTDEAQRAICRARVVVLRSMRKKYPHFDEFLYRAVAPNRTIISTRTETAERLLWLENGCE